jgi:hypothetical protein
MMLAAHTAGSAPAQSLGSAQAHLQEYSAASKLGVQAGVGQHGFQQKPRGAARRVQYVLKHRDEHL